MHKIQLNMWSTCKTELLNFKGTYTKADNGRLLRGAEPNTGIVELLVGLVSAGGVADLALNRTRAHIIS
jgi:hypothetical protein